MATRSGRMAGLLIAAGLAGCATHEPIYHWGNYQPAVWAYFKPNDSAAQAQQAEMEKTVHEAQSKGKPLPPGFQAHLGLLYLKNGEPQKAQLAFETEETQFPESKAYMGFLLKNFAPQPHAPAVAPPLAAPPEATPPPQAGLSPSGVAQ
jgi:hypothetical protein